MEYGFYFLGQWLSYLELTAMLSGILGVWFTIKQNPLCFPIGMLNVLLYAWLFFTPTIRLYADATLQCSYFLLLAYGWFKWTRSGKADNNLRPSRTSKRHWISIILISIPFILILALFLQKYTNADLAWPDSTLTVISLAAQWMVAKKKMENWILWILVDIFYIPLYIYKGLPLTAFLYFIFLLIAFRGWNEWKKDAIKHSNA